MIIMKATARSWNVNVSPKFSREVASAIRGMPVRKAREFLRGVVNMKQLVVLKRHNKEVPHHKGKPSRYPVKVAKHFIEVLENAVANAEYQGLEGDELKITQLEVYRGTPKRNLGSRALGKVDRRGRRTSIFMVLEGESK